MLRRLKIAASLFWLLVAVVLVGLSVWSSLSRFGVQHQASSGDVTGISSEGGDLLVFHSDASDWAALRWRGAPLTGWFFHKFPRNPYQPRMASRWRAKSFSLVVPYWAPTMIAVALAAMPWLRWRFSIRTMLVATTLIAVTLGYVAITLR